MEGIQYGTQQGYNPLTSAAYGSQPYASQFGQPGLFGGTGSQFGGSPFGGMLGSGIGGLLGNQNIGRQPGQAGDGIGGLFQSYGNVDPLTAAHLQQAQLIQAQQAQLAHAQMVQQAQIAQLIQQAQLAQQIAQQQQLGRAPSFGVDPISAAIAQQRAQLVPQAGLNPWLGINPMNRIDPITAAYAQQAQVAQLCQQLGQQGQFGQPFGQGHFGLGQLGGGQNLWANPQLAAQFGRTSPFQYGLGATGAYAGQGPMF